MERAGGICEAPACARHFNNLPAAVHPGSLPFSASNAIPTNENGLSACSGAGTPEAAATAPLSPGLQVSAQNRLIP